MALIRGTKANHPCPICFVHQDNLAEITKTWKLRTAAHTQELLNKVHRMQRSQDREKLLMAHGIRNVNVS